jgi:hypothetical protein
MAILQTSGDLQRIETVPDGQMGAWEYTLRTWSLQSYPHQFRLSRSSYLSVMSGESEKDRFAEQLGWQFNSFPGYAISPERRAWFKNEPEDWRFLGLGAGRVTTGGQSLRVFDAPYWIPLIVFGAPAVIAMARRRTLRARAREGRCLKCGYQLDAGMTTCPECGSVHAHA